jgi:hypothetical protein
MSVGDWAQKENSHTAKENSHHTRSKVEAGKVAEHTPIISAMAKLRSGRS